jgi:parallel beta-helix repeat protein
MKLNNFGKIISLASLSLILTGITWAAGPTYIREGILISTEWTQVGSPYILQGDVAVGKGAVLTIDPGVTIEFMASDNGKPGSGPNLIVQGGLRALGNSVSPISFTSLTKGSLWGALYFANADFPCLLQGCVVKGGRVICNGCSPTITQCAIYGSKTGIEVLDHSQPQIVGNRITSNGVGVALLATTASPTLSKNEIDNNNYGIYLKDFGNPAISGNKIHGNLKYNLVNYSPQTLSIPNNDFQSADAQQIMRTVYDGAYNPSYGRLNFLPYVGMAPGQSYPAVASAGISPEKPSIQEEDFWNYGRPFDAMKVGNLNPGKGNSSGTLKILALGAVSVASVAILFL